MLENGAWLAEKGVLDKGKLKGGVGKWWLWSCRFWMVGTVLEGARLFAEGQMKEKEKSTSVAGGKEDEKKNGKEEIDEEEAKAITPSISLDPTLSTPNPTMDTTPTNDPLPPHPTPQTSEPARDLKLLASKAQASSAKYWRSVATTSAYAPMTLHYSLENGFLSEQVIGVLGLGASVVGLGEVWRGTRDAV